MARLGLSATAVTAMAGGAATAFNEALPYMTTSDQAAGRPPATAKIAGAPRAQAMSRSKERKALDPRQSKAPAVKLRPKPPEPVGHKYVTAPLNMRTGPGMNSTVLAVLAKGTIVAVTGEVRGAWAEIVSGGKSRWVHEASLADAKPKAQQPGMMTTAPTPTPSPSPSATPKPTQTAGGFTTGACPDGSSIEGGLVTNADRVYRAVCGKFPSLTTYGGYRSGDTEHSDGTSVDFMVNSNASLGDAIASWARQNASALHIREVIWSQHIWTVERSGEGWRMMEDRGSRTANHYDHVHVRVYP
jgi:uncharacterized protein YgiM (DUF1202 family)